MQKIILIFLCLVLQACSFHPRNTVNLAAPLHTLYLQTADPYGQLAHNLSLQLKMSGVQLTKTPATATTTLEIISETTAEQLLNISGTQTTRQYNLILTVTYQLTDTHGNILVGTQTATETRPLTINANRMLSGNNEANNLYQQMRQTIVYNIISRLASRDITQLLTTQHTTP